MTSKCTTSAPAATTAFTSSPSRAKFAERIEGAIQGVMAASLHSPRGLDELERLDDLLRALLGVLQHRFRQPVRLEFVRMMFGELPTVRLLDFGVRRLRIDLEHLVGRVELHAARARALARPCAALPLPSILPKLFATEPQHRFHVRELETRDVEQFREPEDHVTRRALHVDTFERRAHLELEERAQKVGLVADRRDELSDGVFQIEVRALAARVEPDGDVDLRAVE